MPTSEIKDLNSKAKIELYSSAFTLSDMEIFVFPQLMYSLVLANIMSPIIWEWRNDSWFKNIEKRSHTQRINRLKQYIMGNFVFNLDLETWGLTTKEKELDRFKDILSPDAISESNALFGYEGDKYYFSIDIRKHFGLDKYDSNVIPYWKTETVEAMTAFRHRDGYSTGAGECVSLSALYAAALFVICRIPLENIFMIATPLHSQNFIDIGEGILTNNRRIVTKNMWFNGTSLSTKARRALENEDITIVSHITGYIHKVYPEATIDKNAYERFKETLSNYLKADLTPWIISNFLRRHNEFQKCFQYRVFMNGRYMFIPVETIYRYEHNSPNNFSTDSRGALLKEIDSEEFNLSPIPERILLNDFEDFIKETPLKDFSPVSYNEWREKAKRRLMIPECFDADELFEKFRNFIVVEPKLPPDDKIFVKTETLKIDIERDREEILNYIRAMANNNTDAELALYAYRDMDYIDWEPFIKAAIERNPVSIDGLKDRSINEVIDYIEKLENKSIYPENRLAQPDEVHNFKRGDGIEKAILLSNIIKNREPDAEISIDIKDKIVNLKSKTLDLNFNTEKKINKRLTI